MLNANSWLGHFILGKTLIESGHLQPALAELQQAFELSGGSFEPLALKAFALTRMGCLDQAKEAMALLHQTAERGICPPIVSLWLMPGWETRKLRSTSFAKQQIRKMCG